MRRWSALVRELMAGRPAGGSADGPGHDTGIALDAFASSLTVTFGFGRTFFARTGLTSRLPAALDPLPPFSSDQLDAKRSDGDLWVQIGADDALVAFHALRAVQKESAGTVKVRWQMNGFNRTPGATARPMTARNLMGQIDGTGNPKPADEDFDRRFAPPPPAPPQEWLEGGSTPSSVGSLCRRTTCRSFPCTGRSRSSGGARRTGPRRAAGARPPRWTSTRRARTDGRDPRQRPRPHSSPEKNGGAAMLRRPFSYHDGISEDGTPDAGLLFVCWQADPFQGFVPVQRKLDRGDALSPFIRHEASGLFAVPGGAAEGEYVGAAAAGVLRPRAGLMGRGARAWRLPWGSSGGRVPWRLMRPGGACTRRVPSPARPAPDRILRRRGPRRTAQ
ncbi:Deferrochelatase OS=Streptomyces microflavus OX=1919 GN=efeB PE=3 SV=1 [Streptomyces microflavus]